MRIEIKTSQYEFSHGKKPRGPGAWAFEIEGTIFWFNDTYRGACESARMKAREKKATQIIVCP